MVRSMHISPRPRPKPTTSTAVVSQTTRLQAQAPTNRAAHTRRAHSTHRHTRSMPAAVRVHTQASSRLGLALHQVITFSVRRFRYRVCLCQKTCKRTSLLVCWLWLPHASALAGPSTSSAYSAYSQSSAWRSATHGPTSGTASTGASLVHRHNCACSPCFDHLGSFIWNCKVLCCTLCSRMP